MDIIFFRDKFFQEISGQAFLKRSQKSLANSRRIIQKEHIQEELYKFMLTKQVKRCTI